NWSWIPDSSGIFVAMDAPQRPSTLGVLDITGTAPRATDLMMAGQTLTRDGRWIIAAHAAGCCAFVTYPEIRVAPRTGGDVRTLVAASTEPKSLALLGIDANDRVVYRDADQIRRIALGRGTPERMGTIADFKSTMTGDTSPDGTVILVRGYEPTRWYVIANDRVTKWDDATGDIIANFEGQRLLFGTAAHWVGPHTALVRAPAGEVSAFDLLTGKPAATKARLGASDLVLAADQVRLLVGRGKSVVVIDLATGVESDTRLDVAEPDGARASRAWRLATGGFVLSTATTTYRID
ncbi:MAG TPA: hypothetical protein VM052_02135, partial [Candidatus Limnocylindrales bacterium]|nr:hypothetical protein [Candidatus Limnocylindrales bacterium]